MIKSRLFSASLLAALAFAAAQPSPALAVTPVMPPQGVFAQPCPIATMLATCDAQLAAMKDTGFQIVVTTQPTGGTNSTAYLQTMVADHLQGMWELDATGWWGDNGTAPWGYNPNGTNMLARYPVYHTLCKCATNDQLLKYMVSYLTSGGATYGWYIADDTQFAAVGSALYAEQVAGLQAFGARLKQLAPTTHTVVAACCNGGLDMLKNSHQVADFTALEMYPIASYADTDPLTGLLVGADVFQWSGALQQTMDSYGSPSSVILQAFDWGMDSIDAKNVGDDPSVNAYPSPAQQLVMRNNALMAANPHLVLWFYWNDTAGWPAGTVPSYFYTPPSAAILSARVAGLKAAVTAPLPTLPTSVTLPTLTGTPTDGKQLVASSGTWTSWAQGAQLGGLIVNLTQQWQRLSSSASICDTSGTPTWRDIASATHATYTLRDADTGCKLRASVKAAATVTPGVVGVAYSAATATISSLIPKNKALPIVSSTPTAGLQLLTTNGTWTGSSSFAYAFQWLRLSSSATTCDTSGTPTWRSIASAPQATYAVGVADVGCKLRASVRATGTNPPAKFTVAYSAATAAIPSLPPKNEALPLVSGTPTAGMQLLTTSGTWTGSPPITYAYQWQRLSSSATTCDAGGTPTWQSIASATQATYAVRGADVGCKLRASVRATGTNPPAKFTVAYSAATAVVSPAPTLPPSPPSVPVKPPKPPGCVVPTFARAHTSLRTMERRLRAAHCHVRHVLRVHSRNVPKGDVVRLSRKPHTRLHRGAPIDITISKGK